jgi:protein arginine N-methyltransferase 1
MYSVAGYGRMLADDVRMQAYEDALRRAVTPGCTVLDIGTGVGVTAILAARCGADRVYAVEPDDAIHVARAVAARNGYADRIEFIQALSTDVTLPRRADVVVSDLRGVLPLLGRHIPSIADARERHLAPGGALIPARDTLWAAVVEAPDVYQEYAEPWADPRWQLDLSPARKVVTSNWRKASLGPDALLAAPQQWGVLDYQTVTDPNVRATLRWRAERPGTAHGLSAWFDATLAEGVGFSNAPGRPEAIYGRAFFPFADPVPVDAGDAVSVELRAHLVGDDYVWAWNTSVCAGGDGGPLRARFRQSTLGAAPLAVADLRKAAEAHVPALRDDGAVDRFVLGCMDGRASVGDIARRLCAEFPGRFPALRDAHARVGALSRRYSR